MMPVFASARNTRPGKPLPGTAACRFLLLLALAGCAPPAPREPIAITPPSEVRNAPVARVPLPPGEVARMPGPNDTVKIVIANLDPDIQYVCISTAAGAEPLQTAITFVPKVAALCRKHPEMGPCQYEREACRRSGGRVFTADSTEITRETEAEYDRKVIRVRFRAD